MTEGVVKTRAWAQGAMLWGSSPGLVGGDPLNNALVALWGFLTGAMGIDVALNQLQLKRRAPQEMEGVKYIFTHLGEDQCVTVHNAVPTWCN